VLCQKFFQYLYKNLILIADKRDGKINRGRGRSQGAQPALEKSNNLKIILLIFVQIFASYL